MIKERSVSSHLIEKDSKHRGHKRQKQQIKELYIGEGVSDRKREEGSCSHVPNDI